MTNADDRLSDMAEDGEGAPRIGRYERTRAKLGAAVKSAKGAKGRHVSIAVSVRAAERNRRVAASVLAGGLAYRLFLWLLPFGLLVGGALGFSNANSTEDAVESGGIAAAVSNAIGDAARAADSESWWLLAVGVPLLLYAGYSGAKAVQLVHSLVWDEPPSKMRALKGSLAFTGTVCAFIAAVAVTLWFRDVTWHGLLAAAITTLPLTALWLWVSLHLPHKDASWRELLPGALFISIGFQVLQVLVDAFLVPKLEKSTSLYGALGAVTTLLFFMYIVGSLVVAAPVHNSSLYHELRKQGAPGRMPRAVPNHEASP